MKLMRECSRRNYALLDAQGLSSSGVVFISLAANVRTVQFTQQVLYTRVRQDP